MITTTIFLILLAAVSIIFGAKVTLEIIQYIDYRKQCREDRDEECDEERDEEEGKEVIPLVNKRSRRKVYRQINWYIDD